MLDYNHIQAKAYDLISAIDYIDGVSVLLDDGEQNDAAGNARRSTGAVIVIRQPDNLSAQASGNGISLGTASVVVLCSFNDEVNRYTDEGLNLDPERVVREVKTAMESYDSTAACSFFQLAGEQLLQVDGLYERQLTFQAWTTG